MQDRCGSYQTHLREVLKYPQFFFVGCVKYNLEILFAKLQYYQR